ncbi:hypothetical protein [Actinomadura algeriensis]|uniref:Uncharacterized protein n=1 Tax=Actinomadura algeriensis TaxID=1679523 RepID=A0ABR9K3I7_9ACTN|nr:hypothetical protein [Actinomadura algeriensis]MBE1537164.1 hypothetical protein [Actinomadura algeriensis]
MPGRTTSRDRRTRASTPPSRRLHLAEFAAAYREPAGHFSGIMGRMATYRDWILIMTYENRPKAPSPMAALRG